MPGVTASFYADFRVRCGAVPILHEDRESPPEYLLQAIWQHQRILRDQLRAIDGTPVRILHPGFRSVEGGPDFRGAVIQFGDERPRVGDVEVDINANGWRAHGHDRNPAFEKVILHVIWDGKAKAEGLPALSLRNVLDASLGELSLWLGGEAAQSLPESLRGKCCAPLRELDEVQTLRLLQEAAQVRLQSKAAQFQTRARQAGWEQALWEGLFKALGYKHNIWPMQRLAELRPRWTNGDSKLLGIQARLLGLSGLLPAELPESRSGADIYVRRVWDHWWRERDEFADCVLPRTVWRFHGIRPANHPERRIALASCWSGADDLPAKLEKWCAEDLPDPKLADSLLKVLQVKPDDFWSWHYTFRSSRLKKAQPLLGGTRVTDLAVNVVLPWLWIRAVEGKNESLRSRLEKRYFAWPAAEDNSLLRLARQRLLGGAPRKLLRSAAVQQGLIQIVRDFCERSNALCEGCKFPELVRGWRTVQSAG
ncbi:MAG TPA: DUF2851 family protein [Candidatus Dormibacteraeota bacterium]|nr:DUF2851 family protein [Candidatus Dormibacteraeota bacterium]